MIIRGRKRTLAPINWENVSQRLSAAAKALDATLTTTPEQAREIMETRARSLARTSSRSDSVGQILEVLVFSLERERYAIETRYVRQVIRMSTCTKVPGTPKVLLGLINLGGDVLPVFDLAQVLGSSAEVSDGKNDLRVVILGNDRDRFGVCVDRAIEVITLSEDEIVDAYIPGEGRRHLLGVTADATGVLDGRSLLNDGHLLIDQSHRP